MWFRAVEIPKREPVSLQADHQPIGDAGALGVGLLGGLQMFQGSAVAAQADLPADHGGHGIVVRVPGGLQDGQDQCADGPCSVTATRCSERMEAQT